MNDRILVLDSRVIDGFEGLLDLDRAVADALGCQDSDIQAYDVSSLDVSRYIYERILDAYIEYRTENWLSSTAPSMEQIKDSYALMAPRIDDTLARNEVRVRPGFIRWKSNCAGPE